MSQEIVGPCACGRFKEFPESIPPLTDGLFHLVAGAAAVCEIQSLRTRLAESEAREEREEQLLAEIARLRDALDKHNRKESK